MFTICDAPEVAHPGFPCRHAVTDAQVLAAFLAENPRLRDDLFRELTGADLATARAATSVADTMSQPAWAETVKSSMSLSGRVSRYRVARADSDIAGRAL